MQKILALKIAFYINLALLIAFCGIFAMPFVAHLAATEIMELAGCTSASFDTSAKCPEGSIAERFAPLAGWPAVFLAPIFFVIQFGDVLLIWGMVTAVLGYSTFRKASAE